MGFSNNFDFKRYINCTRVAKTPDGLNQICISEKEVKNIYEMYHVREYLTRRAYKHETASSINQMVIDAFVKADNHFGFSRIIQSRDIDAFEKLNDSVLLEMQSSNDASLNEAKSIVDALTRRNLYKYVGSTVLSSKLSQYNNDCRRIEKDVYTFF